LKILTVIGARPQFIKAATISRLLCDIKYSEIDEVVVHTGQHYDHNMSQSFFNELDMPAPKYNLEVGSGTHGQQIGLIMSSLEKVVQLENPDWILVYGDTNSTLAAALVAAKKPCRLAHVESGLRSYRWGMPEEVNRVVTDRLSDLLFCPTTLAKKNLAVEGRNQNVIIAGDVMYDSFLYYNKIVDHDAVMRKYNLLAGRYILITIHRAENTDNKKKLKNILSALRFIAREVQIILPLHPRTRKMVDQFSISLEGITVVDPVPYLTMIGLLVNAKAVVTDSGGLQKEAYFAKTPCLTIRDETEWIETLKDGWNQTTPLDDRNDLIDNLNRVLNLDRSNLPYCHYYGSGDAAQIIIDSITHFKVKSKI
jgi:UDP-GlcNAc3NAcA epimerase